MAATRVLPVPLSKLRGKDGVGIKGDVGPKGEKGDNGDVPTEVLQLLQRLSTLTIQNQELFLRMLEPKEKEKYVSEFQVTRDHRGLIKVVTPIYKEEI